MKGRNHFGLIQYPRTGNVCITFDILRMDLCSWFESVQAASVYVFNAVV